MEDSDSEAVAAWREARGAEFQGWTDAMPERAWLYDRFQALWRYDDESTPTPCI
jgi:hypothetical protein